MERWRNRVAVVTGASSGIGAAITKDLVEAGLVVVGLARRVERVEEIKSQLSADKRKRLFAKKCDVSNIEDVNEAFDWIEQTLSGVDILINNAGCFRPGHMSTMDVQLMQTVLQTNVMGVVYCTQRAFGSMKRRNFDGHIVLINSIAGHKVISSATVASGGQNIYSPSKFAITAINEIYRQEFSFLGTNVKVTSISPGLVDTEIVPENIRTSMGNCMLKPKDISQAVLYTLSTPPHVRIHELTIKPVGEVF